MTQRKAFKARVRARMAETNESYAAAAAALEATNPAHGNADFTHRHSAQVQAVLAAAGIEITPAMAFGLGGGIGFMYAIFEYDEIPHPLLTIVAQHHPQPWLDAACAHLGIAPETLATTSARKALAALDQALLTGPVLVDLGRGALADVPEIERTEPYRVLVTASADGYVVDGKPMDAAELSQAWQLARGKMTATWMAPQTRQIDLVGSVRAALGTTVAHMTGPVLNHSFDSNFGLSGLAKWRDQLVGTDKLSWSRRFDTPEKQAIALGRVVDGVDREYTATAGSRPLFVHFLSEAAALLPDLEPAIAPFQASAEAWRNVSRLAQSATPELADLATELTKIIEAETIGLELLTKGISK